MHLLPAHYVKAYRRRNKTDRADVDALHAAYLHGDIQPVPVSSVEQQQLQLLHRLREQWKKTRVARINALRGALRELGIVIPEGARRALYSAHLALDGDTVPQPLRIALYELLEEITALVHRIHSVEHQLKALTRELPDVQRMQQVSGIGLLTATALFAAAGSPQHFRSGKHFASWLGITPKEFISEKSRLLGAISKQGDKYLRTLIIHGARSVLCRATQVHKAGRTLNPLQRWAVTLQQRVGHNKATVALANKLARIVWATWKHHNDFELKLAAA